jgi:NTP pyrophosphatase (non-canonical NTP hydrolase)
MFMDIKKLSDWTISINNKFKKEFTTQGRALSLVSEVGELADAILEYSEEKEKGTRKGKSLEEIKDALADIQYNLFVLASHYKIDLGKEYETMLKNLSKRFESGEFVIGEKQATEVE